MTGREYANRDHPKYPEFRSKMLKLSDIYRKKDEEATAKNENTRAIGREFCQKIKELRQEYSFLWEE